jgi:hypothetical protein
MVSAILRDAVSGDGRPMNGVSSLVCSGVPNPKPWRGRTVYVSR